MKVSWKVRRGKIGWYLDMMSALTRLLQRERSHLRACGPITLSKLLAQYGIERSTSQIAASVALRDPEGTMSARTYLMGGYAERLGFDVAVLQCWEDSAWEALLQSHAQRLDIIINHAHPTAKDEGHYSALMDIDDHSVTLDDPFTGPGHVIDRDRFCELWQPNRETSGHILLAFDRPNTTVCHAMPCGPCPDCGIVPRLSLASVFEPSQWTGERWRRFFCTNCDGSFTPVSSSASVRHTKPINIAS